MKKILSVILAAMMLFSGFAFSASAAEESWLPGDVSSSQCVLVFSFNNGKAKTSLPVYDPNLGNFVATDAVTGTYRMLPTSADAHKAGTFVYLPQVTPPEGSQFDGWYVEAQYSPTGYPMSLTGGSVYYIPEGAAGKEIQFTAWYSPAEPEEDTMAVVMGILIKVFGAIIGILMYGGNTEAGVQMMEKILGGVLG